MTLPFRDPPRRERQGTTLPKHPATNGGSRPETDLCQCQTIPTNLETTGGTSKDGGISKQEEGNLTETKGKRCQWRKETIHARIET